MRATRLAIAAVALGAGLLGWSTAGVTAVSTTLSAETSAPAPAVRQVDLDVDRGARGARGAGVEDGHGHGPHGRPGV
jgi:hypothetical protein